MAIIAIWNQILRGYAMEVATGTPQIWAATNFPELKKRCKLLTQIFVWQPESYETEFLTYVIWLSKSAIPQKAQSATLRDSSRRSILSELGHEPRNATLFRCTSWFFPPLYQRFDFRNLVYRMAAIATFQTIASGFSLFHDTYDFVKEGMRLYNEAIEKVKPILSSVTS